MKKNGALHHYQYSRTPHSYKTDRYPSRRRSDHEDYRRKGFNDEWYYSHRTYRSHHQLHSR